MFFSVLPSTFVNISSKLSNPFEESILLSPVASNFFSNALSTAFITIGEILELNPNAAEILSGFGMGCLGCPSATMETLEQACYVHGLKLEEVMAKLNEK